MRRVLICILFLAAVSATGGVRAQPLRPAVEKAVRAATFEVVVPKIAETESIEYERALPWELVPFAIRNDSYHSIGTAFAIGRNEFVTASHVFASWMGSLYDQPVLRSGTGSVHEIGEVLKFSGHQDFVVFTLKDPPPVRPLATETQPEMNSEVHAVGNALGDGVVIRGGLLTSETPEQEDGRWHWYRFSAAASPGNSGGPLVNGEGRVIGVIVAASPAENLNFALPIRHVLETPAGVARIETRMNYQLPVMPFGVTDKLRVETPLPLSLPDLAARLVASMNQLGDQLRVRYRSELADRWSARSPAAARMLLQPYQARTPRIIRYGDDREWSPGELTGETTAALTHGGEVLAGTLAGAAIVRVRKPDNLTLAGLMADSRAQMDMALKALTWSRQIGSESVRIVSLGPAERDERFEDGFGRRWQLRSWRLDPMDLKAVALLMPVPDGFVALMRLSPTGRSHANAEELKILADHVYLSYGGTLPQWQEFMALGDLRPRAFEQVSIEYVTDKRLRFRSPRFESLILGVFADVSDRSTLELETGYIAEGESIAWDITGLRFIEDVENAFTCSIRRQARVPPEIGGALHRDWLRMVKRLPPYDAMPHLDDGYPRVRKMYLPQTGAEQEPAFVYDVGFRVETFMDLESLRMVHAQFQAGFQLREH
jgi:hypothetical protein